MKTNSGANSGANLKSFGSSGSTGSTGSNIGGIMSTLSSFLTSWSGMLVIVAVVMVLIWVYYETIGYYISLGWKKMRWSHDNKEKIEIDVPGSQILSLIHI